MDSSGVDEATWLALVARDDHRCLHCNAESNLTPAHYDARGSKGKAADSSLGNLMLLCFDCHRRTHDGKLLVKKINGHFFFKEVN